MRGFQLMLARLKGRFQRLYFRGGPRRIWYTTFLASCLVLYALLSGFSIVTDVVKSRDRFEYNLDRFGFPKGTIENPFMIFLWGEPGEVNFDALIDLTITTELSRDSHESFFWLPLNAPPSLEDNGWEGADTPMGDRPM